MKLEKRRRFWRTNPKGALKDWRRRRQVKRAGIVPTVEGVVRYFGTGSGRWPVLLEALPQDPVVWTFGVGFDLGFEVGIVDELGGRVRAFDPTPRSMAWSSTLTLPAGLELHPIGLGDHDGRATFASPSDPRSGNYRIGGDAEVPGEHSTDCEVRRLESLIAEFGERPDLLKVDVEGAEFTLLEQLIAGRPRMLLIEFHHGMWGHRFEQTETSVRRLAEMGYETFWISRRGLEFGFVDRGAEGRP